MTRPSSYLAITLIVAGVALAMFGLIRVLPPLAAADDLADGLLISYFAPPERQHSGIALVVFGEDGMATAVCRSPIDRDMLADLIERLGTAGVRAVGIDVLFDQATLPDRDARLHRTLVEAPVPVVAITALDETPLTPTQRRFLNEFLADVPHGHANLVKSRLDGTVRWHEPVADDATPSFTARIAELLGVPVTPGTERIAWHGRPDAATRPFPVYPAEAVPFLPREWLAGRIVLIGTELLGSDRHRTPLSAGGDDTPGVEIHAHILAQLLDDRHYPRLSLTWEAVLSVATALAGMALALAGLPAWLLASAGTLLLVAAWVGIAALFAAGGPLIPLVGPSLAWLFGTALTTAHLSLRERADRRMLMTLFANHVSQPIADEIWRERSTFMAGGRPRPQELTATVMFSDIEGFTTFCEAMEPEPLMRWLDGYIEAMARIVSAHDGIVLRFIGDGILAVFGVPVARRTETEITADALRAVRCAMQMEHELCGLNNNWQAGGLPPVTIRIGIQTGLMVAGSLGGLRHNEYSLIGDTVNTAARLEAYAKNVAAPGGRTCRILVGDTTWERVCDHLDAAPVGELTLRGKHKLVGAWLVLGEKAANPAVTRKEWDVPQSAG
jgi:adenylate cyclase